MNTNKFESHSSVIFAVGNAALFGIEPVVISKTGGSWYRCVCADGYGLKSTLNICAASDEECDLLVKLAAVMFGITPRTAPYLISGWPSYMDMLVPVSEPQAQVENDDTTDDTENQE